MATTIVEELVPDELDRVRQDLRGDPELAAASAVAPPRTPPWWVTCWPACGGVAWRSGDRSWW
jgi:hypothetical protein